MKNTQENSAWSKLWKKLWDSIIFCKESQMGKYSLDTYLDIVGEYTDRLIKSAEEDGLTYIGGECKITNSDDTNTYNVEAKMFFEDSKGKNIIKEAKRSLPKAKFVSETDRKVGEIIKFEIQRPKKVE